MAICYSSYRKLKRSPRAPHWQICWTSFSLHVSWQKYLVTLVFRSGTSSYFDSHLPSFQQPIKSQVPGIPPTKQIQPQFRLSPSLACIPLCPTWTISSLILTSNCPDNLLQLTCQFHMVQPSRYGWNDTGGEKKIIGCKYFKIQQNACKLVSTFSPGSLKLQGPGCVGDTALLLLFLPAQSFPLQALIPFGSLVL